MCVPALCRTLIYICDTKFGMLQVHKKWSGVTVRMCTLQGTLFFTIFSLENLQFTIFSLANDFSTAVSHPAMRDKQCAKYSTHLDERIPKNCLI